MKLVKPNISRLYEFVGSTTFFWIVVGLLVFQAVWLALSAVYPMAFDEDFHLGVIRLYAHHISPFWKAHPQGADAFGAVARDPSYLYQYLMSFPYRLVSVFTHSEYVQVMTLRAINIGLFVWALTLYRKLLLKTRASNAAVNLSLLVFVLVPIAPYLAGQINYDNLILPLVALSLFLSIRLRHSMKAGLFDTKLLLGLYSLLLGASLVKYAFLPILLAITVYLLANAYKIYGAPAKLLTAIRLGGQSMSKITLVALIVTALIFTGLFVERYGFNVIKYHAPVADCGQVLDYDHCKAYGPWYRDYLLKQNKVTASTNPITFTHTWLQGMWFRSFFAISGARTNFDNKGPLTLPAVGTVIFAGVSLLALILTAKRLWKKYDGSILWLFTGVSLAYTAVLWLDVYQMYKKTGVAVAINGRYLLPIIPIAILISALAINQIVGKHTKLKLVIAGAVLVCYVWGGGFLTYVLRSNDSWYWSNAPLKGINHFLQRDMGPYVPGYDHPVQYMP